MRERDTEGELGGVCPVKISVCPLEFLRLVFLLCCAALKRTALTSLWREVAPDCVTGHPRQHPRDPPPAAPISPGPREQGPGLRQQLRFDLICARGCSIFSTFPSRCQTFLNVSATSGRRLCLCVRTWARGLKCGRVAVLIHFDGCPHLRQM